MKKLLSIFCLVVGLLLSGTANAQQWGVTTNGLYWLTATPNLGVEVSVHPKMTLAASLQYNPFTYKNNRKMKHLLGQFEYRYWLSETFKGHYFGAHTINGMYNFGNLPFGSLKNYRYEGNLFGGGFTYGYQWILNSRLNIGADIGFGYFYMDYQKFYCPTCGEKIERYHTNYLGPTKVGISLIYLLK